MADQTTFDLGHMGTLTASLTYLLAEASGLPDPRSVSVYGILDGHAHDELSLHFDPAESGIEAVTRWAMRFGGVIEARDVNCDGTLKRCVETRFTWQDYVRVEAFCLVTLPKPEAITASGQDPALAGEPPF